MRRAGDAFEVEARFDDLIGRMERKWSRVLEGDEP